jgi:hypothetical protein
VELIPVADKQAEARYCESGVVHFDGIDAVGGWVYGDMHLYGVQTGKCS